MWSSLTRKNLSESFSFVPIFEKEIVNYNRQEIFKVFEIFLKMNEKNSFYHWLIAYSYCSDYNIYGPIYELLKRTDEWPCYEKAIYHCNKSLEYMDDTNSEWRTVYRATKLRLEKGIECYFNYMDTELLDSNDCDILCLKAESRMLMEPWNFWNRETMKKTGNADYIEMILNKGLQLNSTNEWLCYLKTHYYEMGPIEQFDMVVLETLKNSRNSNFRDLSSNGFILSTA